MADEFILAEQIGTAFLQELIADGANAQQVKEKMKKNSPCNPDPNVSGAPTMVTAFNDTMTKPAVIARLHELRDSLPPSALETRATTKFTFTRIAQGAGPYYDPGGFLTGDTTNASVGITNSRELKYELVNGADFLVESYNEPRNTIRVLTEGTYLIHGQIQYAVKRGYVPGSADGPDLQTSPTFISNNDAVVMPYKLFLTVNGAGSAAQSEGNPDNTGSIESQEIINRMDFRYSQEILSGKFTRNEIIKGVQKTRGFSATLKLAAGEMLSLQFQRGQTMATYGEDANSRGITDALFVIKNEAAEEEDKTNWIEFVKLN